MDLDREKDVEQLRRIAKMQQVQIDKLLKVLASQSKRIDELVGSPGELQQALALLEKLEPKKSSAPAEQADDKPKKKRKKRKKFGSTAQPLLPVLEEVFELDAPDLTCPACGDHLRPMAGQFDVSEMVDVVEVSYRILKAKQQKYSCRCGGCVETAPGPERTIAGGRYSLAFAVKVAIDKYLDHLPLTRQARIMKRHGLVVTSQTLWDQLHALAERLRAGWEALFAHVLRQPVIGLDQTSWKRLDKKRKDTPWQMWCLTAPGVVYHRICDDKSAETFGALVGKYEGVIVCDKLKTHDSVVARAGPHTQAGCWAHVFRKFRDASKDHLEARIAMSKIKELYELDASADGDLETLGTIRREQSSDVLGDLKQWLLAQAPLKTLSLGNAARYTLGDWKRLTRFVDDPRIPLDNNATERAVRGPVVGRKNHYGSKSRRGTEVAAILYSLIETAKLHDVEPAAFLAEAARLNAVGEVLLPWQLAER